ncbi:Sec-independent protein translocase protein TatB [Congregibacter sp.]|uniref:Sec-independent protein translocase protein TatB n=1 Tax=Congregibacter sp. TaxID=2744308 RepID=UPI00385B55F4
MFDIGFAELLIIGVVALLVIGPERLPDAVRTASAWLNRIRRGFNDIKQEVQQELHNDAVMKDLRAIKDTGEELRRETQALGSDLSSGLNIPDPMAEIGATPDVPESSNSDSDPDSKTATDSKPVD